MNKHIILLIVLILNFSSTQNVYATETDPLAELKKEYVRQNSVDAQIRAYDALYALPENEIASRADVFSKRIHGYINIANEGIRYVRHHYRDNSVVLGSCESLQAELMTKESEGLTPLEFILFNMKLGLLQEYHPDWCSLELDPGVKKILETDSWKTTPFYEFDPANVPHDRETYMNLECQADLISQLRFSISALSFNENFAFKPYIIYNPKGGFKPSRIAKQNLRPDGKHRSLCALPIGTAEMKNSPHGIYDRTPYTFFTHDLRHAHSVFHKLSLPKTKRFIDLIQPMTSDLSLVDPVIGNFIFLFTHERTYDLWHCAVDEHSSLADFFAALKNEYEQSRITYSGRKHEKAIFDPFPEIMKRILGNNFQNLEEEDGRKLGKREFLPHELPSHYKGVREIIVGDTKSTFEYVVRRADSPLPENPFYEYVEIFDIKNLFDDDIKPLDNLHIEQILAVKGQKHLALTRQAAASNNHREIKVLCEALGKELNPFDLDPFEVRSGAVVFNLSIELLEAFKAKVTELMPGAFT